MAKAKYERKKPHVNVGTIGHVDHGKTTLTSALTKVAADRGMAKFISYDEVAKASESQGRRDATKIMTIAISHVEYESDKRPANSLCIRRNVCPRHFDLAFSPSSTSRRMASERDTSLSTAQASKLATVAGSNRAGIVSL